MYEVPDVISFKDFLFDSDRAVATVSASQFAWAWSAFDRFPYPNGQKLRHLAVLHPFDLTLLRAAAGRVARVVEDRLPSCVYGYRTEPDGVGWRFVHQAGAGWKRFIDAAHTILCRSDVNAMCATDITSYYPTIQVGLLERRLLALNADPHAVTIVMAALRAFRDGVQDRGLPIGPEASAIFGNAFLLDIDEQLISEGVVHLRWMDDYRIFGPDDRACHFAIIPLDAGLALHGLQRSFVKTICYSRADALKSLRDGRLISLGFWLSSERPETAQELHDSWDHEIAQDEPNPSRFRFILKALRNTADDYAAKDIACDEVTAAVDPRLSGDYMQKLGLRHPLIRDEILLRLSETASDRREAIHLHFLRSCAARTWGVAEGKVFESISTDSSRRSPTRCWAEMANSRSAAWRQQTAMERAEAEPDRWMRRALVTTLAKGRGGRKLRTFLEHMRTKSPDLGFTLRWLERAA